MNREFYRQTGEVRNGSSIGVGIPDDTPTSSHVQNKPVRSNSSKPQSWPVLRSRSSAELECLNPTSPTKLQKDPESENLQPDNYLGTKIFPGQWICWLQASTSPLTASLSEHATGRKAGRKGIKQHHCCCFRHILHLTLLCPISGLKAVILLRMSY